MKSYVRTGLIWSSLMLLVMVAIVIWTSGVLPEEGQYPLHWGLSGEPDRFGDRDDAIFALWMLPGAAFLISLLLAVMPYIDPRKRNVDESRTAYVVVWIGVVTLMAFLTGGFSLAMLGAETAGDGETPPIRYIIAGVSLLMVVMGNFLPKTRASFSFGIRTPWTLSSDNVWERTHRFAGPLFMLAGLSGLAGAFLYDGIWLALSLTAPILAAVAISVVYSYFVWRGEARKQTG